MEWSVVDIFTYLVAPQTFGFGVAGLIIAVITIGIMADCGKLEESPWLIGLSGLFVFSLIFLFGLLPTHNRILRVKVAKIKNEAVTSENVDSAVDTIERLGKKLECKYLGCEEKK